MRPTATYRVQLHSGFTFDDAADVADYLAALGASHLYCSPYLQAAPGSTHGYDVVDPRALNRELGGSAGHTRLVRALREVGVGQVLDIVPNHMAVDRTNPWWWDVLENGPASPYATFFDIDWDGDARSPATVLVPILGDQYGRVLEAGDLTIERDGDAVVVRYHEHVLPLSPETLEELDGSTDEHLSGLRHDADRLDELLSRQHYRLAHWRTASDEIDYRRFFDIDTLIGVRVEDPEVFAATHARVLELVRDGTVAGLRIDHVDGLRDPEGYLHELAGATGGCWTVVEKILEPGEALPASWPVAGTSGYDFLIRVNNVFVESANEAAMTDCYHGFTGETIEYAEAVHAAKHRIMATELAAEVERLTGALVTICHGHRRHRDHTRRDLRDALRELVAAFPVYRTYVTAARAAGAADRDHVATAVSGAIARRPDVDAELLTFLGSLAAGDVDGATEREFAIRLQQLTAPVMAKGVEDTAFYRYHRLISLNEVGGDPGVFGRPVDDFHAATAASAQRWPDAMLTLSTHDTKRSADVRARLNVLSEIPAAWSRAVDAWAEHNARHRCDGLPDRNTEYLLYQTLVGAWPIDADRAAAFMAKATREAKVHTSWTDPVAEYDEAVDGFVRAILADASFVAGLEAFLAEHVVVERGRRNSLAQTALLLTCPGVPDVYQGSELWDLSLVDPDNRRPVDYAVRRRLLADLTGQPGPLADDAVGREKLRVVQRVLRHRRERPGDYDGTVYEPLTARHDLLAFTRGDVTVVVHCRTGSDAAGTVRLPAGTWVDLVTGRRTAGGEQDVGVVLGRSPVAVLARES